MNMAHAGHGNSTENPFDWIGKKIAGRSENMQHSILTELDLLLKLAATLESLHIDLVHDIVHCIYVFLCAHLSSFVSTDL